MFDVIILVLILISALFAFFRGFSLELLSISVWIISFFVSYAYGYNLINFFNKIINNNKQYFDLNCDILHCGILDNFCYFFFFNKKVFSFYKG